MSEFVASDYGGLIAERIRAAHAIIAARWLDRLRALLPVESNEVFPTNQLLDHIPALVRELADYVRMPENGSVAANTAVLSKAQELGYLRHEQQASVHQLLQEYRLLGAILSAFVKEQVALLRLPPAAPEVLDVFTRLQEGVGVLLQTTVDTFVAAYTETIARQTARLESFSRMVSHELRQPLVALQYAGRLLDAAALRTDSERSRCIGVINRNVDHLVDLTAKLETLCRLTDRLDEAQQRRVDIGAIAAEVARQLREMADARGVRIRVGHDLPAVTLDVGRLELILVNLVSNAVKYSDPAKPDRLVAIDAALDGDGTCRLEVRDNGVGIDPADLPSIFKRFYRAHTHRDGELGASGIGLGLFIAEECATALGGTITVESTPGEGTVFVVRFPAGGGEPDPAVDE